VIDSSALVAGLKKHVLVLEDDLRTRLGILTEVDAQWRAEYRQALEAERTAGSWVEWRDDRITLAAVAWVLTTVFLRFCEDNALLKPVWVVGPPTRRQEALDAQLDFFRRHPDGTDRDWLLEGIDYLGRLPATRALVDEHSALWLVSPSGNAVTALLEFWRRRDESGDLVIDFADQELSTRFLGDLYQDLSDYAKKTYALLQTPEFVEEFILDQTMEPALAERPLEGFRLIDPACGSGHFLLGAFRRLLERWDRYAPNVELQQQVQCALDAIHGVDINPFAVAISRYRLTVAALKACGLRKLEDAPAFTYHLATGDSLLFGSPQASLPIDGPDRDEVLSRTAYRTEDLEQLKRILQSGHYDVVVGNPPYITVKDTKLNERYRQLYVTCKGAYALTVPFMERFFDLAKPQTGDQPAGWVGQITSNSFMKREFGSKLIEDFLVYQDLRLVVDTSGAYIPGHGTPTVIIAGQHRRPITETLRAVLGIRGEPGRPLDPQEGLVWTSITHHIDQPGFQDDWISVVDLLRSALTKHPWSLSGGGAQDLIQALNANSPLLDSIIGEIGFGAVTREDSAYMVGAAFLNRQRVAAELQRPLVEGENVRDWALHDPLTAIWPYDQTTLGPSCTREILRVLWPYRAQLSSRVAYGYTQLERRLEWFEYSMFFRRRYQIPLSITFAFVATHNHFVLDRGGKVFNRSAPVIKLLQGSNEDDHLGLLGVLNSSVACFWLRQNSHDKGRPGAEAAGADEPWEHRFEFTGTTLEDYPLPSSLPVDLARELDQLAARLAEHSAASTCGNELPTAERLSDAACEFARTRSRMIALQEELDWAVYASYGLVDRSLAQGGIDLPAISPAERPFALLLAREVDQGLDTSWFTHWNHRFKPITEIPGHWPKAYRDVVQHRLDLIESDPNIRLLEKPEYKRRWASEPWEKQQEAALRDWLLDRLEDRRFWFRQGRPTPRSISQLADEVARDPDFTSVLALWEGRRDAVIVQSLTRLTADEAVPYLAAYRLKDTGLRKFEVWQETWALQRREDAGEQVGRIAVPPKYTSTDFRKASWWQARGKLDVPKERFILYPVAGRSTDPTLLLGWAGWDHAEQALALATIIGEREAEGWPDSDLVPLVAGLAELQPWVEQWHADIDPTYGISLAAFCREQLAERARQVNKSLDELADWRPQPTRGRMAHR
jgi:hypothetical protein